MQLGANLTQKGSFAQKKSLRTKLKIKKNHYSNPKVHEEMFSLSYVLFLYILSQD
jgi:hypothetical protein